MTKNIIIKTSVQKRFDSFMVHGRVLFFSAPCGFGKTVLADALLRGRLTAALDAAAEYSFITTVSMYGAVVLPLLEALDWDGDKAWRKRLMAAVRTQAAFYPHFLEPRLAPGEELTPTELQILHLLCADKSNAEIAQIMDVKLPTVKTHVSHILDKLDVKRRAEAKTAAKKLHLVQDDL